MVEYVSLKAARVVADELRDREERRLKRLGVTLTVISVAGISTLLALVRYTIDDQVDKRFHSAEINATIAASASKAVDARIVSLQRELDFQALNVLAFSLNSETSFSRTERDAVMNLLRRLKGAEISDRSEFQSVLQKVVSSFDSAALENEIDEIDRLFGDKMLVSEEVVGILTDHYGRRIAGSRRSISEIEPLVASLRKCLTLESHFKNPEKEIFWELILNIRKAQDGEKAADNSKTLLESLRYLAVEDRVSFFTLLLRFSVPETWAKRNNPEVVAMQNMVNAICARFKPEIARVAVTIPREAYIKGIDSFLENNNIEGKTRERLMALAMELRGVGESSAALAVGSRLQEN